VRDWLGAALAYIGVLEAKAQGRTVVAALLPHFDTMPRDPGSIQLDGGWGMDQVDLKLAYTKPQACDPGCYARADMPEPFWERLKSAKFISFRRMEGMERRNLAPCCGFNAALAGAPVSPEAQDETQHKIQERLAQHFVDFMQ